MAREHATIGRGPTAGSRVLTALAGAACYHNGHRVADGAGVALEHRDRVVLGACTMVFVVVEPTSVLGSQLVDELCTYSDALEELFAGKVRAYYSETRTNKKNTMLVPPLNSIASLAVDQGSAAPALRDDDAALGAFQRSLARVQKDVLHANAVSAPLGLCFEAHLVLGPLPVGLGSHVAPPREGTSRFFGHAPAAPHAFVVKAFFEHADEGDCAPGVATVNRVELLSAPSEVFADVSMAMITAHGDVTRAGRDGLLLHGSAQGHERRETQSFYGAAFRGLDADGRGTVACQGLKDGLARMELGVSEAELQAHFLACGTDDLDRASEARLLTNW